MSENESLRLMNTLDLLEAYRRIYVSFNELSKLLTEEKKKNEALKKERRRLSFYLSRLQNQLKSKEDESVNFLGTFLKESGITSAVSGFWNEGKRMLESSVTEIQKSTHKPELPKTEVQVRPMKPDVKSTVASWLNDPLLNCVAEYTQPTPLRSIKTVIGNNQHLTGEMRLGCQVEEALGMRKSAPNRYINKKDEDPKNIKMAFPESTTKSFELSSKYFKNEAVSAFAPSFKLTAKDFCEANSNDQHTSLLKCESFHDPKRKDDSTSLPNTPQRITDKNKKRITHENFSLSSAVLYGTSANFSGTNFDENKIENSKERADQVVICAEGIHSIYAKGTEPDTQSENSKLVPVSNEFNYATEDEVPFPLVDLQEVNLNHKTWLTSGFHEGQQDVVDKILSTELYRKCADKIQTFERKEKLKHCQATLFKDDNVSGTKTVPKCKLVQQLCSIPSSPQERSSKIADSKISKDEYKLEIELLRSFCVDITGRLPLSVNWFHEKNLNTSKDSNILKFVNDNTSSLVLEWTFSDCKESSVHSDSSFHMKDDLDSQIDHTQLQHVAYELHKVESPTEVQSTVEDFQIIVQSPKNKSRYLIIAAVKPENVSGSTAISAISFLYNSRNNVEDVHYVIPVLENDKAQKLVHHTSEGKLVETLKSTLGFQDNKIPFEEHNGANTNFSDASDLVVSATGEAIQNQMEPCKQDDFEELFNECNETFSIDRTLNDAVTSHGVAAKQKFETSELYNFSDADCKLQSNNKDLTESELLEVAEPMRHEDMVIMFSPKFSSKCSNIRVLGDTNNYVSSALTISPREAALPKSFYIQSSKHEATFTDCDYPNSSEKCSRNSQFKEILKKQARSMDGCSEAEEQFYSPLSSSASTEKQETGALLGESVTDASTTQQLYTTVNNETNFFSGEIIDWNDFPETASSSAKLLKEEWSMEKNSFSHSGKAIDYCIPIAEANYSAPQHGSTFHPVTKCSSFCNEGIVDNFMNCHKILYKSRPLPKAQTLCQHRSWHTVRPNSNALIRFKHIQVPNTNAHHLLNLQSEAAFQYRRIGTCERLYYRTQKSVLHSPTEKLNESFKALSLKLPSDDTSESNVVKVGEKLRESLHDRRAAQLNKAISSLAFLKNKLVGGKVFEFDALVGSCNKQSKLNPLYRYDESDDANLSEFHQKMKIRRETSPHLLQLPAMKKEEFPIGKSLLNALSQRHGRPKGITFSENQQRMHENVASSSIPDNPNQLDHTPYSVQGVIRKLLIQLSEDNYFEFTFKDDDDLEIELQKFLKEHKLKTIFLTGLKQKLESMKNQNILAENVDIADVEI